MRRTGSPYPTEFREPLVALARISRCFERLAEENEPCAATIHDWVKQADAGEHVDRLTRAESEEVRQLHREVKQLRQKRNTFSKASAWFAQNDMTSRRFSNS